jgi:hypothetical protein
MLDAIFITATIGFFAIAVAYVRACEKLRGGEENEP